MTRRGSIVYYLAAWVCGCLFMSLAIWLPGKWGLTHWTPDFRGFSGFLAFYFLGLVFGAFTALLFAFLLRWLVVTLRWKLLWQWTLLGAVVAQVLVWGLGAAGREAEKHISHGARWLFLLVAGPMLIPGGFRTSFALLTVPVGAVTAFVLCFIHRAFAPRADSPQP